MSKRTLSPRSSKHAKRFRITEPLNLIPRVKTDANVSSKNAFLSFYKPLDSIQISDRQTIYRNQVDPPKIQNVMITAQVLLTDDQILTLHWQTDSKQWLTIHLELLWDMDTQSWAARGYGRETIKPYCRTDHCLTYSKSLWQTRHQTMQNEKLVPTLDSFLLKDLINVVVSYAQI